MSMDWIENQISINQILKAMVNTDRLQFLLIYFLIYFPNISAWPSGSSA